MKARTIIGYINVTIKGYKAMFNEATAEDIHPIINGILKSSSNKISKEEIEIVKDYVSEIYDFNN